MVSFLEWSTIVDAPVSDIMTGVEMFEHLINMHDISDPDALQSVMQAKWEGPSGALEVIKGNRAGPKEAELTLEQILKEFR